MEKDLSAGGCLELIGDIARKEGEAAVLTVEAEKTRRAAEVAEESGLFGVPAVLAFDPDAGFLDCERIPALTNLRQLVEDKHVDTEILIERAGRVLATVHLRFRLDRAMRIPLPRPWRSFSEDQVFIHGDFTTNNICYDEERKRLVIVDWSAAPYVGNLATIGPRSFDVAWFVRHLQMSAPWQQTISWPGGRLSDLFMRAYVDEYGAKLHADTFYQQHRLLRLFAHWDMARRIKQVSPLSRPAIWSAHHYRHLIWRTYRPPAECMSRLTS